MSENDDQSTIKTNEAHSSRDNTAIRPTRIRSGNVSAGATRNRRASQRLMLATALGVSLILLLSVIVFSVIRIGSLVHENDAMAGELFKIKQELSSTVPELERSRKELASLIKGRLPYLRELTPDKVINIDNPPIKNVVFTVLKQNGRTRYEFRLVLENKDENMVHPDVRVLAFDQHGVQVGMAEITDHVDLMPGESRSYSSVIDRFMDEEPRYFYVAKRGG